jgi:hypothetical protein
VPLNRLRTIPPRARLEILATHVGVIERGLVEREQRPFGGAELRDRGDVVSVVRQIERMLVGRTVGTDDRDRIARRVLGVEALVGRACDIGGVAAIAAQDQLVAAARVHRVAVPLVGAAARATGESDHQRAEGENREERSHAHRNRNPDARI